MDLPTLLELERETADPVADIFAIWTEVPAIAAALDCIGPTADIVGELRTVFHDRPDILAIVDTSLAVVQARLNNRPRILQQLGNIAKGN